MARRRRNNPALCPCGSDLSYGKCCAPFHRGEATPESPQALVRARYSAYAKQEVDYIIDTTDPDGDAWQQPQNQWRIDIRRFGRKAIFVGVDIVAAEVRENSATVTFVAKLRRRGNDASFTEVSQFTCRDGHWLYAAGRPQS